MFLVLAMTLFAVSITLASINDRTGSCQGLQFQAPAQSTVEFFVEVCPFHSATDPSSVSYLAQAATATPYIF
jgi:hypothetical protein